MGHPLAVPCCLEGGVGEILTAVWFLETQKPDGKRALTCIKLGCFSAERKSKGSFQLPHDFTLPAPRLYWLDSDANWRFFTTGIKGLPTAEKWSLSYFRFFCVKDD